MENAQTSTWQGRVQAEYVDLKTKIDALTSHLLHNAQDMEEKAVHLLRLQLIAMKSYLTILEERMTHHAIAIPGLENSNG